LQTGFCRVDQKSKAMRKNDDFRKLLEQARSAPEKKAGEAAPVPGGGQKKRSQGSEKYRRLLDQKAKQKERDDDESRYRDRADERRKEKESKIDDPEDGGVAALAAVDIEMSKYLGGDLAHTHLVKGLDYALLNKVRGEGSSQQQQNDTTNTATADDDEEKRRRGVLKTTKV